MLVLAPLSVLLVVPLFVVAATLDEIRATLSRYEDTLIHSLLARSAQACPTASESSHLDRYFTPHPIPERDFDGLPPFIDYVPAAESQSLRSFYYSTLLPALCNASAPAADAPLLSAAFLQTASDRIAIGADVAHAKFNDTLCPAILDKDTAALLAAVTVPAQEKIVLDRVYAKAQAWAVDPSKPATSGPTATCTQVASQVQDVFKRCVSTRTRKRKCKTDHHTQIHHENHNRLRSRRPHRLG